MKKEDEETENPIDRQYKSLDCDLQPLDHSHADFKVNSCSHTKVTVIWKMALLSLLLQFLRELSCEFKL